MARIPTRPTDTSVCKGLKEEERNMLSYYVLFGCTKEYAFERFMLFEYKMSKVAITKQSNQFFASKEAQAYLKAYRDTIDKFVAGESQPTQVVDTEQNASDRNKKRKLAAAQKIIDYVIKGASEIDMMDDPETFVKLADKVGLFDDFEQAVESPRRYLPETCGSCRFFQFCTSDDVIDECPRCKYKEYANSQGVYYDHKDMLNQSDDAGERDNRSE